MKKALAILISCAMLLMGCGVNDATDNSPESIQTATEQTVESVTDTVLSSETEDHVETEQENISTTQVAATPLLSVDTTSEDYINTLGFTSLNRLPRKLINP